MGKPERRVIIIIVSAIVVLAALSYIIKQVTKFRYEKHLEDTVVTVDTSEVSLREFGCYIYDVEAYIQEQALIYDAENPTLWWNTHFSAGPDSAFISDYAKRTALDMCACTEIYVAEANQKGIALDASEEAQAASEAEAMYTGMSVEQRKSTGLTLNDVTAVKKKRALAAKYVTYLAANTDFTGYPGTPQQELNWDGSYYKQFIMPLHTVKENEKLLEHITFGTITVNME